MLCVGFCDYSVMR
ncbi:hypothetical protein FLL89_09095 [Vibrio cholerae]|nr:hypothetical protein FLL90_14370 [Vibrio cholerae]TQP50736.1 hypothetical protein FLL90_08125 [Vibrio cholerae]TQP79365.1 hypothetical protein FLL89_17880 [Vibrio cholerae]TQP83699.1 hypothetical protein FLL89_09095 [Vibrio cholerae]